MRPTRAQFILVAIQFLKLQIAGNIIFWGTYLGYFVSDFVFDRAELWTLALASLIAHGVFFVVTRDWVFDSETGQRKSHQEVVRFMIFMGFNFFLNLAIIEGLRVMFGISPYIGQFVSGLFFGIWTYLGLKFWVFREAKRYAPITITIEKKG